MIEQERDDRNKQDAFRYIFRQEELPRNFDSDIAKGEEGYFSQNSLIFIEKQHHNVLFVPAYLRCHFRNMTQMDIQNLSCTFIATMNIAFYLGKYEKKQDKDIVQAFAEHMHDVITGNLKLTFQNDFVINMGEDVSSSTSDSDRLVRVQLTKYKTKGVTRYYSNIVITRGFKFGLHADIFFFPLQQNLLDLVTTLHPIKTKIFQKDKQKSLTIRFNCMDLQIGKQWDLNEDISPQQLQLYKTQHSQLIQQLKELYMLQKNGREMTNEDLIKHFIHNRNYSFFRDIKMSFPLKKKATEFGYYNIIEKDIKIEYTRKKHIEPPQSCYQSLKNCLFCKKKIVNYDQNQHQLQQVGNLGKKVGISTFQSIPTEDRFKEESFCNAIMTIPMLKASLGTIIQLCIPIFFLSFLTLVTFLYSRSTTEDQVRGLKISSSTLIVATYISFIYSMRTVIPPTPSWSLFQVAVCLLAASCLAPIIQSIYQSNITSTSNPFIDKNGLFIASFILNASVCLIIIIMLISVKIYMSVKIQRKKSRYVSMADLVDSLTKKYFYLWKNAGCKVFLSFELKKSIEDKAKVRSDYY